MKVTHGKSKEGREVLRRFEREIGDDGKPFILIFNDEKLGQQQYMSGNVTYLIGLLHTAKNYLETEELLKMRLSVQPGKKEDKKEATYFG